MHSFDDYYYFFLVVKHGGYSAASEVSNITKSKLSRRILELEAKFNVNLIQRSTRHFKVTPLGQEFYQECVKVIAQVECAENVLLKQKSEPQGLIRISCPTVMMHFQIRHLLNEFLKQFPKVEVELELTSRRVDLIHDDIDLAIRTNFQPNQDSSLIVRDVIKTSHCLVASPTLLNGKILQQIDDLMDYPSIALGTEAELQQWQLYHPQRDEKATLELHPRMKCNDLAGVYYAALDGLGIADLPYLTVEADIQRGKLIHVLPEWQSNLGTVQLVYASRKGQRLVMQKLIDVLVDGLRDLVQAQHGYSN
ncbi:DNA-binding transcriptional LysR family regulator [Acinetobacter calcoaceticus]|uniref:DNA-binding transcriptional LysR family regulator n=1 Tax=Acinetobacter calcoaceticus TaxID=471 RepID=A0A4R1Y777_ACICA|nr:DNA-binding transcriptional LysR family regulator [Acinetobacter calcoaceticus]